MRRYSLIPKIFLLFTLGTASIAVAQNGVHRNVQPAPTDRKSLQAYLLEMFHAYQSGNEQTFDELVNQLRLTDPEQFFRAEFNPDQIATLKRNYEKTFNAFRDRIRENIEAKGTSRVQLTLEHASSPAGVEPASTAPVPKTSLDIQSFKCVLAAKNKPTSEWEDSFTLVDGGLRFIGQGAYPFWSAPLTIRLRKNP